MKKLIPLLACLSMGLSIHARPNIVWIFSDDHSFQAIGAYGGRLQSLNPTPNIDRIAHEGMRFDRCYVGNSICGPSRATLLTGKHSHMNGMTVNNGGVFDHNQEQFQKILQTNGYQTALIGKIHIAGDMQGFDYWDVLRSQGDYNNSMFISEDGQKRVPGYVSDVITDKSLDWLKTKRDPAKPFMLMVHHKAPHRIWIPDAADMKRYKDIEIPEPDTLFDNYETRTIAAHDQELSIENNMRLNVDLKVGEAGERHGIKPAQYTARNEFYEKHKPTEKELVRWKYQLYMKDYLRCIWSMDESIGRILDTLKEMGLDENTIVMYSSDQGFYNGEHGWFDKRFMYEESYRTPLVARWPGTIKPGSVNTDLVQNIDFAETFLDLASAPIPDTMQGRSVLPLLKGQTPADWRSSLYYHYYEYPRPHRVRKHEGVSNKRYKLIRFYGPDVPDGEAWEFYDLEKDPSELNNTYSNPESAEIIAELKKELQRLRVQYEVPDVEPTLTKKAQRKKSAPKKGKK